MTGAHARDMRLGVMCPQSCDEVVAGDRCLRGCGPKARRCLKPQSVPIRFWQDAFLFDAVIALGGGVALGLGLRTK